MGGYVQFRCSLAAAAVIAASSAASAEDTSTPSLRLLVYNYAAVRSEWVRGARESVTRIYRDAGIDILWIDPLSDEGRTSVELEARRSATFTVRVMIRPKRNWGQRKSNAESVMGDALPADACAGTVSLFYEQLLEVTGKYHQPIADVLALALAHEIGHVLLPPPSHSTAGVMQPTWDGDDIRRAVLGHPRFNPEQVDAIRKRVAGCRTNEP